MRVGILGLQGGIYEHLYHLKKSFTELGIDGEIKIVTDKGDLKDIDGIIIPGGESTTIGRLMTRLGLTEPLRRFITDGNTTLGICAGAILLAREAVDAEVGSVQQPLLNVMNIRAIRNYFGRQKNSFETLLEIKGLEGGPYKAIFIRAPVFQPISNSVEELAKLDGKLVMAREENILVTSFHPELTRDNRIHKMFINMHINRK